jgi:hypothetical protein
MAAGGFVTRFRQVAVALTSLEFLGYMFANFVFGAYVLSLCGALLGLPSSLTGDVMSPIYASLMAWIIFSVYYLLVQFSEKRWTGALLGCVSLAASSASYGPIMKRLATMPAPWFVSTLSLEVQTRLLIGLVFCVALVYVFLSPKIWERYIKKSEEPLDVVRKFLRLYPSLNEQTRELVRRELR